MPYSVAIIGTGGISRAHARACAAVDQVDLVAAVDINQENLEQFGSEFGVTRLYNDVEQMLGFEKNIDIAIVCNWGAVHAETCNFISRSQGAKAILCEKPFSSSAAEAEEMVSAARSNDVLIAEAFKFRHHPQHTKAKQMIDSGIIGEVKNIRSAFCTQSNPGWRKPSLNWRFNKEKGGSCINDLACYCVHHARFILDAEPKTVFAAAQMGVEVEEAADINLVFPNDVCAQISVGFSYQPAQFVEISGTKGMFRIDPAWNNEDMEVTLYLQDSHRKRITYPIPKTNQFVEQLKHLCNCLASGTPHRISPENSIAQMKVLDAVFESVRAGASVRLSDSSS